MRDRSRRHCMWSRRQEPVSSSQAICFSSAHHSARTGLVAHSSPPAYCGGQLSIHMDESSPAHPLTLSPPKHSYCWRSVLPRIVSKTDEVILTRNTHFENTIKHERSEFKQDAIRCPTGKWEALCKGRHTMSNRQVRSALPRTPYGVQ